MSYAHIVSAFEQSRLDKEAIRAVSFCIAFSAYRYLRSLFFPYLYISENLFHLFFVYNRAELSVHIRCVAYIYLLERFYRSLHKFIVYALLDEYTRSRGANFALVEKNAELQSVYGFFKITVIKEDIRALSAKLESGRDKTFSRRFGYFVAYRSRTCETQLFYAGVIKYILACLIARACYHIQYARREYVRQQIRQHQSCYRCAG